MLQYATKVPLSADDSQNCKRISGMDNFFHLQILNMHLDHLNDLIEKVPMFIAMFMAMLWLWQCIANVYGLF